MEPLDRYEVCKYGEYIMKSISKNSEVPKKFKIYISKSKNSNFDDVLKLKSELNKYDVEILEFQGGTYSPDLLKSADIMILVPPKDSPKHFQEEDICIGRGQYEELIIAENHGFISQAYNSFNHSVSDIVFSNTNEVTKDYNNWGFFNIEESTEGPIKNLIKDLLGNDFKYKEQSIDDYLIQLEEKFIPSPTYNKKMLLITKNKKS